MTRLIRCLLLSFFAAGLLLLATASTGYAQTTLNISHDRTPRLPDHSGGLNPRIRESLELDPQGIWGTTPVARRMYVGVPVKLDLVAQNAGIPAQLEGIQWTIDGATGASIVAYRGATILSNRSASAGYRTLCNLDQLNASDLNPPNPPSPYVTSSITVVWTEPGTYRASVTASVDSNAPQGAIIEFDVQRLPKAEIIYATGSGAMTGDPSDNLDNILGEYSYWYSISGSLPAEEFLRFHRGFIQKANCWRSLFGYPTITPLLPAPSYVPGTNTTGGCDLTRPQDCHAGSTNDGNGIVFLPRDATNSASIAPLPGRFTNAGDGTTSLADFPDLDALAADFISYYDLQRGFIAASGDLNTNNAAPADPLFWRLGMTLTKLFEYWQYLQLDGNRIEVRVNNTIAIGMNVTFPDPNSNITAAMDGTIANCWPMSGSFFPIGTTTVDCTVPDITSLDPDSPAYNTGNTISVQFEVSVLPPDPTPSTPVDVFIVLDLTGSYRDNLPTFQTEMPQIIDEMQATYGNIRFGIASFQDYPIDNFGSAGAGDKAYERLMDLTYDLDGVKTTIAGLTTRSGSDLPESQLAALYQAATGYGQDLSGLGYPGASIPSGQRANFNAGAAKILMLWTDAPFHQPGDVGAFSATPYPGPSLEMTVNAINALDPPRVIGISSYDTALPDLRALALATGTVAPAGGVDCDNDGKIDIPAGEPIVCSLVPGAVGVGKAMIASVDAVMQSPMAEAGPLQVIESTSPDGTLVTLDGSGSSDPQGDELTYAWSGNFGSASGMNPNVTLPLGRHTITLTVSDSLGNSASDSVLIIVRDSVAPVLVAPEKPACLRTVRHKRVVLRLGRDFIASDNGDASPELSITDAESDRVHKDWHHHCDKHSHHGHHGRCGHCGHCGHHEHHGHCCCDRDPDVIVFADRICIADIDKAKVTVQLDATDNFGNESSLTSKIFVSQGQHWPWFHHKGRGKHHHHCKFIKPVEVVDEDDPICKP
ncbi:MAG: hypothetical protein JW841_11355 [Deltaproteobacteria bacterium]|nr:hypothetical protein [Deltaproteobacteria bacterium]